MLQRRFLPSKGSMLAIRRIVAWSSERISNWRVSSVNKFVKKSKSEGRWTHMHISKLCPSESPLKFFNLSPTQIWIGKVSSARSRVQIPFHLNSAERECSLGWRAGSPIGKTFRFQCSYLSCHRYLEPMAFSAPILLFTCTIGDATPEWISRLWPTLPRRICFRICLINSFIVLANDHERGIVLFV